MERTLSLLQEDLLHEAMRFQEQQLQGFACESECVLCKNMIEADDEEVVVMFCGHIFHRECVYN